MPYSAKLGLIRATASGMGAAHILLAGTWFNLSNATMGIASIVMAVAIPAIIAAGT